MSDRTGPNILPHRCLVPAEGSRILLRPDVDPRLLKEWFAERLAERAIAIMQEDEHDAQD